MFPVIIWSEFRLGKYRDDNHREDAPHFTSKYLKDEKLDL